MKVYLAGPMTGLPDYNFPAFDKYAQLLRDATGFEVVSPAEVARKHWNRLTEPFTSALRRVIFAHDLTELSKCDAIALMPGWQNSGGAQIEYDVADYLGLAVIVLEDRTDTLVYRVARTRVDGVLASCK